MQKNLEREKIVANLYDEINIIIDYTGLTDKDIVEKAENIDTLMKDESYNKCMAPLTYEEIESYSKRQRRELSLAAKRTSIEEENSMRYIRNDNLVEVVIYRSFSQIRLEYDENTKHILRDYFSLLANIIKCLNENKSFFKIQTVYLQKKNKIFSKSLYQIFRCFERNMFGTFIQGRSKETYVLNIIQNRENFFRNDLEFDVVKAISSGMDDNTKKDIYMGQLDIMGRYDAAPIDNVDIKNLFGKINDEIYDIFKRYLTEGFLGDMVNGQTSKLIGGFHL